MGSTVKEGLKAAKIRMRKEISRNTFRKGIQISHFQSRLGMLDFDQKHFRNYRVLTGKPIELCMPNSSSPQKTAVTTWPK